MLAEIYNWFTEGFDTADLKDAKALLDELSKISQRCVAPSATTIIFDDAGFCAECGARTEIMSAGREGIELGREYVNIVGELECSERAFRRVQ